jgi:hypothetical protein
MVHHTEIYPFIRSANKCITAFFFQPIMGPPPNRQQLMASWKVACMVLAIQVGEKEQFRNCCMVKLVNYHLLCLLWRESWFLVKGLVIVLCCVICDPPPQMANPWVTHMRLVISTWTQLIVWMWMHFCCELRYWIVLDRALKLRDLVK